MQDSSDVLSSLETKPKLRPTVTRVTSVFGKFSTEKIHAVSKISSTHGNLVQEHNCVRDLHTTVS